MMSVQEEQEGNGWDQYQKLVLSSLARLEKKVETIGEEQAATRVEIAVIKQKAAGWGMISGAISAGIAMGIGYLKSKTGGAP